jgi:endonuclease IV
MIGPHVYKTIKAGKSIQECVQITIDRAQDAGFVMCAFQVFLSGPRTLKMNVTEAEACELNDFLCTRALIGIAHGNYIDCPWTKRASKMHISDFIRQESTICKMAGLSGLVIHLPSAGPETIMDDLKNIHEPNGVKIFLETPHVKPKNSNYETPAKIAHMFSLIDKQKNIDKNDYNFGICIDTAHLWSCGVDISSYERANLWILELMTLVPANCIIFHLNDSTKLLGEGVDNHASLFCGNIWKKYNQHRSKSGAYAFIQAAIKYDIPTILERKTSAEIAVDFANIHDLFAELSV